MTAAKHLPGHDHCRACGDNGFLINQVPEGVRDELKVETTITEAHQGWLHLPHGGIGMALILELARSSALPNERCHIEYPFRGAFRWGGPAIAVGDHVTVCVHPQGDMVKGAVWKTGEDVSPYLSALLTHISSDPDPSSATSFALSLVSVLGKELRGKASVLPRYRKCFVCGMEREAPGLRSTFYRLAENGIETVFSFHGLDPDDENHFYWLRISDKELHPGVVASVMDEVMGWSGFLTCKQGGVTVRLEIDFFRPVIPGERLLCYGRATHVRGKNPHRLFWYAEGVVIPLLGEHHMPLAIAKGQWLSMPMLTEELKSHLIPQSAVTELF